MSGALGGAGTRSPASPRPFAYAHWTASALLLPLQARRRWRRRPAERRQGAPSTERAGSALRLLPWAAVKCLISGLCAHARQATLSVTDGTSRCRTTRRRTFQTGACLALSRLLPASPSPLPASLQLLRTIAQKNFDQKHQLRALTIKQLADATLNRVDDGLTIDGREVTNVRPPAACCCCCGAACCCPPAVVS